MNRRDFTCIVVLALSVSLPGSVRAQLDDAQIAEQMDQLAILLGLPPVAPEVLERRVEDIGELRFRNR